MRVVFAFESSLNAFALEGEDVHGAYSALHDLFNEYEIAELTDNEMSDFIGENGENWSEAVSTLMHAIKDSLSEKITVVDTDMFFAHVIADKLRELSAAAVEIAFMVLSVAIDENAEEWSNVAHQFAAVIFEGDCMTCNDFIAATDGDYEFGNDVYHWGGISTENLARNSLGVYSWAGREIFEYIDEQHCEGRIPSAVFAAMDYEKFGRILEREGAQYIIGPKAAIYVYDHD